MVVGGHFDKAPHLLVAPGKDRDPGKGPGQSLGEPDDQMVVTPQMGSFMSQHGDEFGMAENRQRCAGDDDTASTPQQTEHAEAAGCSST